MGDAVTDLSPDLRGILENTRAALADGLVPARILNDPELYRVERNRVFTRAWSFVGHESEIPSPGDYAVRYIGEDPFIFVRGEDGVVRVMFNACRHRGTQICRVERGNASHFRCPYHAWTFKNNGDLTGVPAMKDAAKGLDREEWGLLKAPNVASYHGLVFASLDEDAPPLEEYLGDVRYYLEPLLVLNDDFEVIGSPHRWIMQANWKQGAENFAGDDYHLTSLHRSLLEVGAVRSPGHTNMIGQHILAGNGHALSMSTAESVGRGGDDLAFWGYPREIVDSYDRSKLSDDQFELAERTRVIVGTVFPNLSYLCLPLTGNPNRQPPTTFMMLRQWQPLGPDSMELWNWVLVPKRASQEFRDLSVKAATTTFGSSGIFEQDDAEPWQSIARTAGSAFTQKTNFLLNYQMGLRIGTATPLEDWPGPGVVYSHRYEEGVHRVIYERWVEFMLSDAYPPCRSDADRPTAAAA